MNGTIRKNAICLYYLHVVYHRSLQRPVIHASRVHLLRSNATCSLMMTKAIGNTFLNLTLYDKSHISSPAVGEEGYLRWGGEWVSFVDTMLQMQVLGLSGRSLRLPTRIRSLRIDPAKHAQNVTEIDSQRQGRADFMGHFGKKKSMMAREMDLRQGVSCKSYAFFWQI